MQRCFLVQIVIWLFALCGCVGCVTTLAPAETPSPTPVSPPANHTPTPNIIVNRTTQGIIGRNETWRGEIRIIGDIIVEKWATLTIEPGTKVLIAAHQDAQNLFKEPFNMQKGIRQEKGEDRGIVFGEPYRDEGNHISIRIWGTLHAVGTPDQMITITSDSQTPTIFDWNHFQFENGIMSYCLVEYYRVLDPGDGTIVSYNIFRNIGEAGVAPAEHTMLIEYNKISHAGHELIYVHGGSPTIRHNQLGPNPKKPGIHVEGTPQIISNDITECGAGIDLFSGVPHISGNRIENCIRGIKLHPGAGDVVIDKAKVTEDNIFSKNGLDISDK